MKLWPCFITRTSKWQWALLIAITVAFFMGSCAFIGQRLKHEFNLSYEKKTVDLRYKMRGETGPQPNDSIVIVAIDDQSLEHLNARWPWPRSMYAQAIDNLSRAGAEVIAFDLVFSQPTEKELEVQDRILGEAIVRSRAWIVMASKFYTRQTHVGQDTSYVAPIPKIDPGKTHVGYVNYWADLDGVVRQAALLRQHQGKLYHSFVLKILSRYFKIQAPVIHLSSQQLRYGPLTIPVEPGANLIINYRGGPGNFKTISFENILDAEVFKGLLENRVFQKKIVLIGPTFIEAQDYHLTPFFSENNYVSGVEVHANVLQTILEKNFYRQGHAGIEILIFFILNLLLAAVNMRLRPWQGLGTFAALAAGYFVLAFWIFLRFRFILPIFNPFLSLIITQLGILTYFLVIEQLHSHRIKGMFSRYVSPKIVEQLVKDPHAELKLGGKKQIVTVLFSDIREFTGLAERLSPEKVVEQLNEYFQVWTDIIFQYDGMVDKFIGDAIMAVFGTPVAHPDDPIRAVQAALDMQKALQQLQRHWESQGRHSFQIGIGINTGEAIVGNMGSHQAMGYTVIGDTVNLASRLENKTKDLGVTLLISETTYQAVKAQIQVQEFHGITVKGKSQIMSVYGVKSLLNNAVATN